jgi:hypothetical protein
MSAPRTRPGRSSPRRRRLNAILLSIIGFVVLLMIIGALSGSHPQKAASAASGVTATAGGASAPVTATVSPEATVAHSSSPARSSHAAAPATHQAASPLPSTPKPAASRPATRKPSPKPTRSASPTALAPAGCYPKTNGGNCYEPGEYCRDSDHGMTGVAGDGEKIQCEDNDGWRWEPV